MTLLWLLHHFALSVSLYMHPSPFSVTPVYYHYVVWFVDFTKSCYVHLYLVLFLYKACQKKSVPVYEYEQICEWIFWQRWMFKMWSSGLRKFVVITQDITIWRAELFAREESLGLSECYKLLPFIFSVQAYTHLLHLHSDGSCRSFIVHVLERYFRIYSNLR
jgi:hypothetical protein